MKSPPELWAEVSDPDSLARHLGAFGEIRITRLEPEATVAWEGDRARGTVNLTASGWGTKVHLTAEPVEPEEPEAEEPAAAAPESVAPESVAPEPEAAEPGPEPVAAEPGAAEPEPEPVAGEPAAAEPAKPPRRRFFARLFGRRAEPAAEAEPGATDDDSWRVPHDSHAEAATSGGGSPAAEPAEAPVVDEAPVAEVAAEAEESPQAPPVVPPAADAEDIVIERVEPAAVLDGMLDTLGAAHHRPFSR